MLVEELRKEYLESGNIERLLEGSDIVILKDFLENWEAVLEFNRKFYPKGVPKTVLCGINPGRLGAGKTGVPFTDFKSLSRLIPNITRQDTERTAQFFHEIVDHFGAQNFYQSFYVTNVSWFGYAKGKRNLNFNELPVPAKEAVKSLFSYEMSRVNPITFISIGDVVKKFVESVLGSSARTDILLWHPYYCSFPSNKENCKRQYIEVLEPFI
jgi:hypothetical protein